MKILFALRLYSGLENSVINEKWQPNGIPTIYKLLEDLDEYLYHVDRMIINIKRNFKYFQETR